MTRTARDLQEALGARARLRSLATAVVAVVALGGGFLASAAAAGTPTATSSTVSVKTSVSVLRAYVIRPGGSYTFKAAGLPADARTATFTIGAQFAWRSTDLSLCGGKEATAGCRKDVGLRSLVKLASWGSTTVDVNGDGGYVTLYNTSASVSVSIRLTSYTVLASSPWATAVPSATIAPTAVTTPKATAVPTPAPSTPTASPSASPTKAAGTPAPTTPSAPATSGPGSTSTVPPSAGRPGPGNTGVPAGTALTVHDGDLHVTTPNAVVDSMRINGIVWIEAPGVVIKNSLITGRETSSDLALVMVNNAAYSATITDSELYAASPSPHMRGVIGQNITLTRVNIHDVIDQVLLIGGNVTVSDSWLHDNLHYAQDPNYGNGPSHDDNFQISIGSNIVIKNNSLSGSHNAVVQVTQDRGDVSGLVFAGNKVDNGACALNLAEKSYGPLEGFSITGNVFGRTQVYSGCAILADASTVPLLKVSGNVWTDGTSVAVRSR